MQRDGIVVADGGETSSWMEMVAKVYQPGHWLSHGYLGCLGTGLPFAIATKVAHPDRQVVCVIGDGSVGFDFSEFDTMVRHGLEVVVVVNNDQQWGMSAHGQDLMYGRDRRVVTDLGPTRYDLAAAGFGCHAEHVVDPSDLVPALERALACGRPACVNVMTDPSVISPVTQAMVGSGALTGGGPQESVTLPYCEDLDDWGVTGHRTPRFPWPYNGRRKERREALQHGQTARGSPDPRPHVGTAGTLRDRDALGHGRGDHQDRAARR